MEAEGSKRHISYIHPEDLNETTQGMNDHIFAARVTIKWVDISEARRNV